DDHLMDITHVIRGEEWLSSTPKHILMYEYFGWEPPKVAHLPLIMSPSGGKLSKRKAESEGIPINTRDYIDQKFEPEALANFLAYLGWSPGDDSELHSMNELKDLFSLDRVSKGGAVFDYKKLLWYNEHYLRKKSADELFPREEEIAHEYDIEPDEEYMKQIITLMKDRVSKVEDLVTMGGFFFEEPDEYEERDLEKWKKDSREILQADIDKIEEVEEVDFEAGTLKDKIKEVIADRDIGFGPIMMPLRVAISGMGHGPDLTPTLELLGKDETIERIKTAIERLG